MYPNEETYPTTESEKENLRLRSAESTVICDHFQEGNHHTLGQISRESHHPDDPKLPQNASSCLFARILLPPLLFLTEKKKHKEHAHTLAVKGATILAVSRTNLGWEKSKTQWERLVFQASFFRGELFFT